jgi:hypothetical protein
MHNDKIHLLTSRISSSLCSFVVAPLQSRSLHGCMKSHRCRFEPSLSLKSIVDGAGRFTRTACPCAPTPDAVIADVDCPIETFGGTKSAGDEE